MIRNTAYGMHPARSDNDDATVGPPTSPRRSPAATPPAGDQVIGRLSGHASTGAVRHHHDWHGSLIHMPEHPHTH